MMAILSIADNFLNIHSLLEIGGMYGVSLAINSGLTPSTILISIS